MKCSNKSFQPSNDAGYSVYGTQWQKKNDVIQRERRFLIFTAFIRGKIPTVILTNKQKTCLGMSKRSFETYATEKIFSVEGFGIFFSCPNKDPFIVGNGLVEIRHSLAFAHVHKSQVATHSLIMLAYES